MRPSKPWLGRQGILASPDEVRARRVRRPAGTGFSLPRFVLLLLPVLFAAAALLPWALTQTVLVPTPAREPDLRLLLTAGVTLFLVGLLVSVLLRAFLLLPVARAADAAQRAADGDASAWPELEVATGAARDLGAILADTLRRGEAHGAAEQELAALSEALEGLHEEARAIAAGDWTRRPQGELEVIAALAERIAAQAERSAALAAASGSLAEGVEAAAAAAGAGGAEQTADQDPGAVLADAAVAAEAVAADLARLRAALDGAPEQDAGPDAEAGGAAGAEAAQRLGLLALNASLEAGRIGGVEAGKFGALAEELGREAERVRAALLRPGTQAAGRPEQDLLERLESRVAELGRKIQAGRARSELAGRGTAAAVDWSALLAAAVEVTQQVALVRLTEEDAEPGPPVEARSEDAEPQAAEDEPGVAQADAAEEFDAGADDEPEP